MDISNLKEEELHPRAKETLDSLRECYVARHREVGLMMRLINHRRGLEDSTKAPSVIDLHMIRAHQIALAECQLSKIIKGE